jgi:hypothetical protein
MYGALALALAIAALFFVALALSSLLTLRRRGRR